MTKNSHQFFLLSDIKLKQKKNFLKNQFFSRHSLT